MRYWVIYAMPWHSEEVFFRGGLRRVGGGRGRAQVLSYFLHVAAILTLEFKSVQRKFGESGKVINVPLQERRRKLD